jgi:FkbH-like protein
VPGAPAALTARFNACLAHACREAGVSLLDLAGAEARDGRDAWFDRGRWFQAKMEIAPQAAARWGERLARVLAAHRGRARKCLVLDLDNTLWGGVVGDDGIAGIRIGQGSAEGEAHLALQRHAKALAGRGVILAVCSKNERDVAEAVFREHPDMALRLDDIAAFVANWDDKAANLRAIAAQLNIGLDSLVFVDDNPAERARIRASLPEVAVPELPADPAGYVDALADAGYFEAVAFTEEDRSRNRLYADAARRAPPAGDAQSLQAFLRGLDMVVEHGSVGPLQLERATQLINKTHQFNTTTQRRSADEVRAHAQGAGTLALQFRLLDRLGDNGLVSVVLLRDEEVDGEGAALDIEQWVMSCRVFGRGLEFEILNIVAETAWARGARWLRADFVPSDRNGVIAGLFERLGFERVGGDAARSRWQLTLAGRVPHHTSIRRKPGP